MLDRGCVCVGGTAFPKVCFPRWCKGALGRGFLGCPWGWAGRGRPPGLGGEMVSVLCLPEPPARAERGHLGGGCKTTRIPSSASCPATWALCPLPEACQDLPNCPSTQTLPQSLGSLWDDGLTGSDAGSQGIFTLSGSPPLSSGNGNRPHTHSPGAFCSDTHTPSSMPSPHLVPWVPWECGWLQWRKPRRGALGWGVSASWECHCCWPWLAGCKH